MFGGVDGWVREGTAVAMGGEGMGCGEDPTTHLTHTNNNHHQTHDHHVAFQTGGRIESILMSLPETARWEYDHQVLQQREAVAGVGVLV